MTMRGLLSDVARAAPMGDVAAVTFGRAVSGLVHEALGEPLEDSGQGIAEGLRRLVSADLCIVARFEDGGLTCRGVAGDVATRIEPGGVTPLRAVPPEGRPEAYLNLLGAEAQPEPFGEYLRLLGFEAAWVVPVATELTTLGAVLLAYREPGALREDEVAAIAAALQSLALVMRQSAMTAPETAERYRQTAHTQKMEALGSMAGMIAHDFNNLLTTIMGYTSILKNGGRLDSSDREYLDQVEEASRRAADLTSRLLAFARGGVLRSGTLDLRAVVRDAMRLGEAALHDRVSLSAALPEGPVAAEGDDGQIQQAILNVLLNARDAMPEGGHVEVSLVQEGEEAVIRIADDGPGMDAATRERIFDPFFTTKPAGSGTGLGMSISYGIVKAHGGVIDVESAPGKGTTFWMRLPARPGDAGEEGLATPSADHDLVLVVDDDSLVRQTTVATLGQLGYNVVDAPSGRVAIELVRARPERFGAVLLDLVMPELTGGQTLKELRKVREDLPVIICTGYAADAHLDEEARAGIAGLVYKPFSGERLAEVLEAAGVVS